MKGQRGNSNLTNHSGPTLGTAVPGKNGWVVVPRQDPSRLSWNEIIKSIQSVYSMTNIIDLCYANRETSWITRLLGLASMPKGARYKIRDHQRYLNVIDNIYTYIIQSLTIFICMWKIGLEIIEPVSLDRSSSSPLNHDRHIVLINSLPRYSLRIIYNNNGVEAGERDWRS